MPVTLSDTEADAAAELLMWVRAFVQRPDFRKELEDSFFDNKKDGKGHYIVSRSEKAKFAKLLLELDGAQKRSERDQGLAKLPAVHQTANITQNFALPKALFDTLTDEQKRIIASTPDDAVRVPAQIT